MCVSIRKADVVVSGNLSCMWPWTPSSQDTAVIVLFLWLKELPDVSCHLNKLIISSSALCLYVGPSFQVERGA